MNEYLKGWQIFKCPNCSILLTEFKTAFNEFITVQTANYLSIEKSFPHFKISEKN